MMDFAKLSSLSIPEGDVNRILIDDSLVWKSGVRDLLPQAIDTDGSIYNGCGYMNDYRLNSSSNTVAMSGACHTGFMPAKFGDTIYADGVTGSYALAGNYIVFYDSDFNVLLNRTTSSLVNFGFSCTERDDGTKLFVFDTSKSHSTDAAAIADMAYFRLSFGAARGVDVVVAVNEEIM